MTVSVETDFLLALVKNDDRLTDRAADALAEHEVVTSPYSYLELLLVSERYDFEHVTLFSNLLELVPVASDRERQIVLKAVAYFEDGLTAFDAFHVATAETRGDPVLGSDTAYEAVDPERLPLEDPE